MLPKYIGMLGVIASFVFWAWTNRLEPFLFTGFLGMIGIGHGLEALAVLKRPHPDDEEGS